MLIEGKAPEPLPEKIAQAKAATAIGEALAQQAKDDKFFQLLAWLFNEGEARTRTSTGGLENVKRFCDKIDRWAGFPIQRLRIAAGKGDTSSMALADQELERTQGLPAFDPLELEGIRAIYLPPHEKENMEVVDGRTIRRRGFVAGGIATLAASTLGGAAAASCKPLTPEQKAEREAHQQLTQATSASRKIKAREASYRDEMSNRDYAPEVIKKEVAKTIREEKEALEKYQAAQIEREKAGQSSPQTNWRAFQEIMRTNPFVVATGVGVSIGLVIPFVNMVNATLPTTRECEEIDQYNQSQEKLREILVGSAKRIGRSVDPLLSEIAHWPPEQARAK